jgi:ribose transport system permease protein
VRATSVRPGHRERLAGALQRNVSLGLLVLVALAATLAFPDFASRANLSNVAIQNALLALVAVGMTFVIISGGIDLSVGSVFALGGVLAGLGSAWGPVVALLLPLLVGLAIGAFQGLLIGRARMAPFIVTLAGLLFARGAALAISDQLPMPIQGEAARMVGQSGVAGLAYPVFIALAVVGSGAVVLNRTRYGQSLFAIGGSEEAARLMGLTVWRSKLIAYATTGALSALAGALLASRLGSGLPTAAQGMELNAIAAVVIGGTLLTGGAGTMSGTLAGVLLLGIIQNLINQVGNLGSYTQQVVSGAFLLVVVVVQRYLTREQRL